MPTREELLAERERRRRAREAGMPASPAQPQAQGLTLQQLQAEQARRKQASRMPWGDDGASFDGLYTPPKSVAPPAPRPVRGPPAALSGWRPDQLASAQRGAQPGASAADRLNAQTRNVALAQAFSDIKPAGSDPAWKGPEAVDPQLDRIRKEKLLTDELARSGTQLYSGDVQNLLDMGDPAIERIVSRDQLPSADNRPFMSDADFNRLTPERQQQEADRMARVSAFDQTRRQDAETVSNLTSDLSAYRASRPDWLNAVSDSARGGVAAVDRFFNNAIAGGMRTVDPERNVASALERSGQYLGGMLEGPDNRFGNNLPEMLGGFGYRTGENPYQGATEITDLFEPTHNIAMGVNDFSDAVKKFSAGDTAGAYQSYMEATPQLLAGAAMVAPGAGPAINRAYKAAEIASASRLPLNVNQARRAAVDAEAARVRPQPSAPPPRNPREAYNAMSEEQRRAIVQGLQDAGMSAEEIVASIRAGRFNPPPRPEPGPSPAGRQEEPQPVEEPIPEPEMPRGGAAADPASARAAPAPFSAAPEPLPPRRGFISRNADTIFGGGAGAYLGGVGEANAADENETDPEGNPAVGAGVGGAIGMAIPRIGRRFAGQVARTVGRPFNPRGYDERIVAGAVRRDLRNVGITNADEAAAAMAMRFGDKPSTIADLTQEGINKAAGLSRLPGETPGKARIRYEELGDAQKGRLERDIASANPNLNPGTITGNIDEMIQAAREQATPAYNALRANYPELDSPRLRVLLDMDVMRPHVEAANAYATTVRQTTGRQLTDFEIMDLIKRNMDAAEQKLIARPGASMDDLQIRQIEEARSAFVRELDQLMPEYAAARKAGGEAPIMKADFEKGQRLLEGRYILEDVTRIVTGITDRPLTALQAGVIRSMVAKAQNTRGAVQALSSSSANKKLAAVFGQEAADAMQARFKADAAIMQNAGRINPNVGSVTGQALMGGGGFAADAVAAIRALRNPTEAGLSWLSKAGAYSEAQRDLMGQMLLEGATPENLARIFPPRGRRGGPPRPSRRGPPPRRSGGPSAGPGTSGGPPPSSASGGATASAADDFVDTAGMADDVAAPQARDVGDIPFPAQGAPEVPEWTGPRPKKPQSLLAWIRSQGGIKDTNYMTGDLKAIMGRANAYPGLLNNKSGTALDLLARRAYSEGFDVDPEDANTLMRLIDEEFGGDPSYRIGAREEWDAYQDYLRQADRYEADRAPDTMGFGGRSSPAGARAVQQAQSQGYAGRDIGEAQEWVRAREKGLDMSQEGRMARAQEMGFDVETPLYHGTPDSRGVWSDGFKTPKEKFGDSDPNRVYFFAEDHRTAATYADDRRAFDYQNAVPETIPVYLRMKNPATVNWNGRPFRGREKDGAGYAIRDYIDQARAAGHDGVIIRNVIDTYDGKGKPTTVRAVFDPANIRSVNAAFDPGASRSSNILAGMGRSPVATGTVAGGTAGAVAPYDSDGDGQISANERAASVMGGMITGGIGGAAASRLMPGMGRKGPPPAGPRMGPRTMGVGGSRTTLSAFPGADEPAINTNKIAASIRMSAGEKALTVLDSLPNRETSKGMLQALRSSGVALTPEERAAFQAVFPENTNVSRRQVESFFKTVASPRNHFSQNVKGFGEVGKRLTDEELDALSAKTAPQVVSILNDLRRISPVKEGAAVAIAGAAKKGWYLRSQKALEAIFGVDAARFAAVLAAMSPQTSVESNLTNAVSFWTNWTKAGRPTDEASVLELLGQSVQGGKGDDSVLDAWRNNTVRAITAEDPIEALLSGPKVDSFRRNMRAREVSGVPSSSSEPARRGANVVMDDTEWAATLDAWMANYFDIDQELFARGGGKSLPGYSAGYLAGNAYIREVAEYLTKKTGEAWSPREVQETIWSWAKTLYEARQAAGESRSALQLIRQKALTDAQIGGTPDFAILLSESPGLRVLLEEAGYGRQITDLAGNPGAIQGNAPSFLGVRSGPQDATGSGFSQRDYERQLGRAASRLDDLANRRARDAREERVRTTRSNITSDGAVPRSYARGSGRDGAPGRVLGQRAVATYTPDREYQRAYARNQIEMPVVHELPGTSEAGSAYAKRMQEATSRSPFGAAVNIYSPEEYAGMRLFVAADGKAGFALKGDDIVSVWSDPKGPPGRSDSLIPLAVQMGGRRLDAFDTVLPSIYSRHGFQIESRLKWNDQYAPSGWDKAKFAKFNNGEPDVVFMVWNPEYNGAPKDTDGVVAASYDEAVAVQSAAQIKIAERISQRALEGQSLFSFPGGGAGAQAATGAGAAAYGYAMPQDFNEDGAIDDTDRGMTAGLYGLGGLTAAGLARARNASGRGAVPDGATTRTFGGENAKTADKRLLGIAKQMEKAGGGRDQIWRETGWGRSRDGKWRFEIDDSKSGFRLDRMPEEGRTTSLGNVLEHEDAYAAYPTSRDIQVVEDPNTGRSGAFYPGADMISLRSRGFGAGGVKSTALHENQHAIQELEGFAAGGSPSSAYMSDELRPEWMRQVDRQLTPPTYEQFAANPTFAGVPKSEVRRQYNGMVKDIREARKDPYHPLSRVAQESAARDIYRRLAGEVEARNVQTRRDMTPDERRANPPWNTQDVPDDQQIVRMLGGPQESSLGPPKSSAMATQEPVQPPPVKGPPGSSSIGRMIGGGAIGGALGAMAGEAEADSSSEIEQQLQAEMAKIAQLNKEIEGLMADQNFFRTADNKELQRRLAREGFNLGPTGVDGILSLSSGRETLSGKAIREFKANIEERLNAANERLNKAEGQVKVLMERDALQRNRPNFFIEAAREYGPTMAGVLAGFGLKYMRGSAAKASVAGAKAASQKLNRLITPISKEEVTGMLNRADESRPANLNQLWQKGGAKKDELPFLQDSVGKWKPNPKAKPADELFQDDNLWKQLTRYVKGKDLAWILGSGGEAAVMQPFIDKANKDLVEAERAWKDNPSDETYKRVEDAKNAVANYTLLQRLGMGVAGGRIIGSLGAAYAKPQPNIVAAATEQAALKQYIASTKPPPKPRGPRKPKAPPPVESPKAQSFGLQALLDYFKSGSRKSKSPPPPPP